MNTEPENITPQRVCPNAQLCILINQQTHTHTLQTQTHTHTYTETQSTHTHTYNHDEHAKHNQLSQNPLTGVVTTELEKFYLRTFCLFVAILLSF